MNTNELAVKIRPEKNSSRTINDAVEIVLSQTDFILFCYKFGSCRIVAIYCEHYLTHFHLTTVEVTVFLPYSFGCYSHIAKFVSL